MNVSDVIKQEMTKLLTDAENSQIGKELVSFIKNEVDVAISDAKAELKAFIDSELAKLPKPSAQ